MGHRAGVLTLHCTSLFLKKGSFSPLSFILCILLSSLHNCERTSVKICRVTVCTANYPVLPYSTTQKYPPDLRMLPGHIHIYTLNINIQILFNSFRQLYNVANWKWTCITQLYMSDARVINTVRQLQLWAGMLIFESWEVHQGAASLRNTAVCQSF